MRRLVAIRGELGITILMVEQSAAVALEIADYGYVLENGRIVLDGDRERLACPRRYPGVLSRPVRRQRAPQLPRRQAIPPQPEVVWLSWRSQSLTLRFGGLTVLEDVSFAVEPGELFALIGPNGAGKTSVLNCISGIYRGDGRIRFRGEDIARPHAARDRAARHRAHLPARRAVSAHDACSRTSWPGGTRASRTNPLAEMLFLPQRAARGGAPARGGRADHRVRRAGALPPRAGRQVCRSALRRSSASPARWRSSRRCSCSTSRPPASIARSAKISRASSCASSTSSASP